MNKLGKRPTSAGDGERSSRPFGYSFQGETPVCTNYAFQYSDRPRKRCTRKFGKVICACEDDPRERGDFNGDAAIDLDDFFDFIERFEKSNGPGRR